MCSALTHTRPRPHTSARAHTVTAAAAACDAARKIRRSNTCVATLCLRASRTCGRRPIQSGARARLGKLLLYLSSRYDGMRKRRADVRAI